MLVLYFLILIFAKTWSYTFNPADIKVKKSQITGFDLHSIFGEQELSSGPGGFSGLRGMGSAAMRHLGRAAGMNREMTSMIAGMGKFAPALIGAVVGLLVLREAIHLVIQGIKQGAEAYQQGARTGMGVGRVAQIGTALKSIGMNASDQDIMQIGRTGYSNNTQFLNMADEFKSAMEDGASSARQMAGAAKELQQTSMNISSFSREWKTLWVQLGSAASSLISLITGAMKVC